VAYPFLSDEWVAEARSIRAAYGDQTMTVPLSIRMNIVVNEVPFGEATLRAYVDTSTGEVDLEFGQLPAADVTVALDYGTARGLLVGGDPQALLAAFLGGRIKIDGDITKLLELQTSGALGGEVDPLLGEVYGRIRAITE
jgi:hypothetical protein